MVQEIDDNIQALDEEIGECFRNDLRACSPAGKKRRRLPPRSMQCPMRSKRQQSIATRSQDGATEADDIRDRAMVLKTTTENDKRTKAIHAEINED